MHLGDHVRLLHVGWGMPLHMLPWSMSRWMLVNISTFVDYTGTLIYLTFLRNMPVTRWCNSPTPRFSQRRIQNSCTSCCTVPFYCAPPPPPPPRLSCKQGAQNLIDAWSQLLSEYTFVPATSAAATCTLLFMPLNCKPLVWCTRYKYRQIATNNESNGST